jgi:hypothetical protein
MSDVVHLIAPRTHGAIYESYVDSLRTILASQSGKPVNVAFLEIPSLKVRGHAGTRHVFRRGRKREAIEHQRRVKSNTWCVGPLLPDAETSPEIAYFNFRHTRSNAYRAIFLSASILSLSYCLRRFSRLPRYRYRGVVIGDLSLATAFRNEPGLAGRVQLSRSVLNTFARAILIVDAIHKYHGQHLAALSNDAILTTYCEHTYIDSLVARTLAKFGIASVGADRSARITFFCASTSNISRSEPWLRRPWIVDPQWHAAAESEGLWRSTGLARRSELLERQLGDGGVGFADAGDSCKFRAVIYLHDFGDGQYFYGIDDFRDLQDWVNQTIDLLLQREDTQVLIKRHPHQKTATARHNQVALSEIERRWGSAVTWVSPAVGLQSLVTSPHTAIITHHGTIAEELALLRMAAIASRVGPWGSDFTFSHTYRSIAEYRKILFALQDHCIDSGVCPRFG